MLIYIFIGSARTYTSLAPPRPLSTVLFFNIKANHLVGPALPASVGNLTSVQIWAMDLGNQIGGELPATLGNIKQMILFTMVQNKVWLIGEGERERVCVSV